MNGKIIEAVKKIFFVYSEFAVYKTDDGYKNKEFFSYEQDMSEILKKSFSDEEILNYERLKQKTGICDNSPRFDYIKDYFSLSDFEIYCLKMAAAVESDRSLERICSFLHDDFSLVLPTVDLCVRTYTLDTAVRERVTREYFSRYDIFVRLFYLQNLTEKSSMSTGLKVRPEIIKFLSCPYASSEILSENLSEISEKLIKIKPFYSWNDLILPDNIKSRLKIACNQVKLKNKIYDEWGFNTKLPYGTGVSMLFFGPPGTGKTMTAQVIANELGLDIYKADLSTIMSKYVGEMEKNIKNIFDTAGKSESILFFDEADALFGKRSEIKDAHDKYANAETAYLLQKIEEYDGIVILASNFYQNFDDAFKRRIKFIIDFPFPDAENRLLIWKSSFPANTPTQNIDFIFLAESFEISGSNIKNSAVYAAFLAAAEMSPVNMKHILLGIKNELSKLGINMKRESLGYYEHLFEE